MKEKNDSNNTNIFRLLRIARDKKVKDVAHALMVTPAYINAIESGERYPSKRLIKDYAEVLEVDEDTITLFENTKQENQRFENVLLSLLQQICEIDK